MLELFSFAFSMVEANILAKSEITEAVVNVRREENKTERKE
jgi:hypothetical protein